MRSDGALALMLALGVASLLLSRKANAMTDAANAGLITTADEWEEPEIQIDPYNTATHDEWDDDMQLPDLTDVIPLKISDAGIEALKAREGFSATAYRDGNGFSVGYGHFILPDETFDASISTDEAEALLAGDVEWAEKCVARSVHAVLTQNAFDALVSFVYNVGAHAFETSTLLRKINAYDPAAPDQFDQWVFTHIDGQKVKSDDLAQRRYGEKAQFLA